eukprot:4615943-Prymnesium_polylepis.1
MRSFQAACGAQPAAGPHGRCRARKIVAATGAVAQLSAVLNRAGTADSLKQLSLRVMLEGAAR